MIKSIETILFNWGKRPLLLLSLILLVIVFFIQPVQGASLIADLSDLDCNFTSSFPITRPSLEGEPTKVSIGIYLLDLVQLNEIRESFEAKFLMKLQWQDPYPIVTYFVTIKKSIKGG